MIERVGSIIFEDGKPVGVTYMCGCQYDKTDENPMVYCAKHTPIMLPTIFEVVSGSTSGRVKKGDIVHLFCIAEKKTVPFIYIGKGFYRCPTCGSRKTRRQTD